MRNVHVVGRRVLATIIDLVVAGLFGAALLPVFGEDMQAGDFSYTALSNTGRFVVLLFIIVYHGVLEGTTGRTLGKLATGIRVVDEATGATPGLGKAFLRSVLLVIDGLFIYLVAMIVILTNDRRRRLGDMAAKTLVVRA
ncbi:RDD family protein [Dactylosporangium salmoneum]|uniref:RDD family protein n=1 Tax=Dactylosporangium salmoneum TaxID=53361 RepID=UPI0031D99DE9